MSQPTEPRTYCIGLPVIITVHDDGTVQFEIDKSEAYDIWEGAPTDDEGNPTYDEAQIQADSDRISAAT